MQISHKYKFIFIHIAKTAGTSIRTALLPYIEKDLYPNRHFTVKEFREYHPDVFDEYFKFAFVRNPWDMVVSQYEWIRKHENLSQHEIVKNMEFSQFVNYSPIVPQYIAICNNGKIDVDFVGKFERLEKDLKYISKRLGIKITLPSVHINCTNHPSYRDYYNESTKMIIEKNYRIDINLFSYRF